MSRILLTGATGAFGSVLLGTLTQQGHDVVCLARGKGPLSAYMRVLGLARERKAVKNLVHVIHGDVRKPQCGVSAYDRDFYRRRIDLIIHCAASISFDEKDRDLTYATNVTGVHEMLALAETFEVDDIRHISTTYIAGNADNFSELDRYKGQRWRNVYEETKHAGETLVRAWALSAPARRYMMIRPAIIVGSFETGWTPTFDAFYGFFRAVFAAKEAAMSRIRTGESAADIFLAGDDKVNMPLVVRASQTSTLNLVPIDWCAQAVAKLVGLAADNRSYHLAHQEPPLVAGLIRDSLNVLGIEGAHIAANEREFRDLVSEHSPLMKVLQRKYGTMLNRYVPYTTHEARFGTAHLREALGGSFASLPPVDAAMLGKLLGHAKRVNWQASEPSDVSLEAMRGP